MNKSRLILLLIVFATIIAFSSVVSATNLEDMKFNVPTGFEKIDDAAGLQFVDESKGVRIRIFDDEMDKWDDGFTQYNETVLISNETIGGDSITDAQGNELSKMPKSYLLAYGEYIKINGKEYWVEVSNDDISEQNAENCLETLKYFNEHNTFEPVEV